MDRPRVERSDERKRTRGNGISPIATLIRSWGESSMSRNSIFVVPLIVGWSLIVLAAARAEDSLLDDSAGVERIVSDCKFTEGPAVDAGGNLFFSDGAN